MCELFNSLQCFVVGFGDAKGVWSVQTVIFIFQYKHQLCCRVILRCGCWSYAEESYAVLTSGNKIVQCSEIKTWCVIR